jgi:hypothetical protein
MPSERQILQAAKASDLDDLLSHIAWEDVLLPEIQKTKNLLTNQLMNSALGMPCKNIDGTVVTSEQLAGKLWGLDWLITRIERILKEGHGAAEKMRTEGYSLE